MAPKATESNDFVALKDAKDKRSDLEMLAIGKHAGLSFSEINELRICDLVAYADLVTGADEGGEARRAASQEQIDKFFH